MERRYERKFLIAGPPAEAVEYAIRHHPAHFRPAFPPRFVNNLYFDSHDLRSFHDTVDGMAVREKLRVRWYGPLFGRIAAPSLELKAKRGFVVAKRSFAIEPFQLDRRSPLPAPAALLAGAALPGELRERAAALEHALVNRYRRRYLLSADGALRLTLDTDLEFYSVRKGHNAFLRRCAERGVRVVELKYADAHDDLGREAAARFPFRLTRSSKYARGVAALAAAHH